MTRKAYDLIVGTLLLALIWGTAILILYANTH